MTEMPSQIRLLSQAIDFANQSHHVISQNLANVNTPNYQAREISFRQFLEQTKHDAADGQPPAELKLQYTQGLKNRADGNNVDLDTELANLKRNDMAHQTLTQLLGTQMSIMRKAITG